MRDVWAQLLGMPGGIAGWSARHGVHPGFFHAIMSEQWSGIVHEGSGTHRMIQEVEGAFGKIDFGGKLKILPKRKRAEVKAPPRNKTGVRRIRAHKVGAEKKEIPAKCPGCGAIHRAPDDYTGDLKCPWFYCGPCKAGVPCRTGPESVALHIRRSPGVE